MKNEVFVLNGFGGIDKLAIREISKPSVADYEVLVNVKSISINPEMDVKTRGPAMTDHPEDFSPLILGLDNSDMVTSTVKKAINFKPGDEMFGLLNFPDMEKHKQNL